MGITLKAARINCNMTQEEVAKVLNVSKYTIGNWENGRSFPDASKIKELERVYKISYNDIIFFINK